eukprot:GHVL01003459.1.p2 GENE.GHVL01003459.1~~GHVL01003459.1.p2  ORF type:complete len:358 (-),score=55.59 GHVL01003459.1:1714-2787(-)
MLSSRFFKNVSATSVAIFTSRASVLFNLAFEEYLFNVVKNSAPTLFLWQNDKAVVIGKHQNPWKECNLQRMETDNVILARRETGGGAVYQDMGNTCFSFHSPSHKLNKINNTNIICDALKKLGFNAEATGRNDICVEDGRKISGCAFKKNAEMALHHGTILIDVELEALNKYLTPHEEKLNSKGVSSTAARVVNLKQLDPSINHELVCDNIISKFCEHHHVCTESIPVINVTESSDIANDPQFVRKLEELENWEWRFGRTPKFSHEMTKRFDFGLFNVHLDVHNGRIKDARVFSDCLSAELPEVMSKALIDVLYTPDAVHSATFSAVNSIQDSFSEFKVTAGPIGNWIASEYNVVIV